MFFSIILCTPLYFVQHLYFHIAQIKKQLNVESWPKWQLFILYISPQSEWVRDCLLTLQYLTCLEHMVKNSTPQPLSCSGECIYSEDIVLLNLIVIIQYVADPSKELVICNLIISTLWKLNPEGLLKVCKKIQHCTSWALNTRDGLLSWHCIYKIWLIQ